MEGLVNILLRSLTVNHRSYCPGAIVCGQFPLQYTYEQTPLLTSSQNIETMFGAEPDSARRSFPPLRRGSSYAGNRITSGPYAGRTLSDLSLNLALTCSVQKPSQTGNRFPVLVKILDCAQWLSLQVHPNDEQAKRLEGEGMFGKTEAWHVFEAEPNAELIAGIKPNVSAEQLTAIQSKMEQLELVESIEVKAGDTLFMIRAPSMHWDRECSSMKFNKHQTSPIESTIGGGPKQRRANCILRKHWQYRTRMPPHLPVKPPQIEDGEVTTLTNANISN
jgi:hypothetical protein